MKALLFRLNDSYPIELLVKYLTAKKTDFWLYVHNANKDCYLKTEFDKVDLGDSELSMFICLKDFGERIEKCSIPILHIFLPDRRVIRYDEVLIGVVEEDPDRYDKAAKVCEIPSGAIYRIRNHGNFEQLELKSEESIK